MVLQRRYADQRGFTLIELMVVVLIIGVLATIALPTFLGARTRAQDSAAKSTLANAEKTAALLGLEDGQFQSNATLLAILPTREPSIAWVNHTDPSTGPQVVSIDEDGGNELNLAAASGSGTCFYLRVVIDGPTARHMDPSAGSCEAHDYQGGPNGGW